RMRIHGAAVAVVAFVMITGVAAGQGSAPASLSSRTPGKSSEKARSAKISEEDSSEERGQPEKPKETATPGALEETVVTEIYADQTVFDSTKSIGVFTGHVVVTDPRFNIQGDKLTILISKKQNEGFEKAIVEGNVGVVRDRPSSTGGPPEH